MPERDDEREYEDAAHHGGNGATRPPSARELMEQGERLGQELVSLASTARHAAEGWEDVLRQRITEQPYATLAVAAGVGYVIGGGLPTGLFRVLFGLGARALFDSFLAQAAPGLPRRR